MAYTDLAELKTFMGAETILQLTDDTNSGQISTENVDKAISDAQVMIDVYTRGRYPADIADEDLPASIKAIATAITAQNLYRRRLMLTMPESLKADIKLKIKMLEKIQSGKISPFEESDEPATIVGNKASTDRTYTKTLWNAYD